MLKFTFFKTREPKRYDYYPRYYDPDKEDLENRIKRAKAELGIKDDEGNTIRQEIKFKKTVDDNWRQGMVRQSHFSANVRLVVILIALCGLFYYIYSKLDMLIAK